MAFDRRDFIGKLFSCGGAGALLLPMLMEAELNLGAEPLMEDEAPHDSLAFWTGFFDSVNPNVPASAKRGDDTSNMPDPARVVQYMHYSDDKGLRYADDIEPQELLDYEGDVVVDMSLGQYRPASGDVTASQFRIDCVQTKPLIEILSPLAWSAMVAIQPNKAGSMPSLDELGFKSGSTTTGTSQIVLPKGLSKLSVNVTRNNTKMQAFFGTVLKYAKMGAPVLSLPAISVPAIQTFSEVYSYWEERTRFVMNSPLQLSVASQQALKDPDSQSSPIKMLSGNYVMLPQGHAKDLAPYADKLTLQSGYLVEKDAPKNVAPQDRWKNALPGITYATMRVNVSPLDSSKLSASNGSGSPSGAAAKAGGAHKTGGKEKEGEKPCGTSAEKSGAAKSSTATSH